MRRKLPSLTLCLGLVSVLAAGGSASAGETLLGLKAGGLFPQPFSSLGTSFLVDLEFGATLPIAQGRLTLMVDFGVTQPQADGTANDPRVDANGGAYSWHLDQREMIGGLSLLYRPVGEKWTPYVGVGPRLFILESTVTGQAGMSTIASSDETSVKVGVGVPIGLEMAAGPGRLVFEVALNIGPIDHRTTGDDNTGSLAASIGYRLVF